VVEPPTLLKNDEVNIIPLDPSHPIPRRLLQQPCGHARHALVAALARRQPRAGGLLSGTPGISGGEK